MIQTAHFGKIKDVFTHFYKIEGQFEWAGEMRVSLWSQFLPFHCIAIKNIQCSKSIFFHSILDTVRNVHGHLYAVKQTWLIPSTLLVGSTHYSTIVERILKDSTIKDASVIKITYDVPITYMS